MKRFWDKVKKTDNCWIWLASNNGNGYGQFYLDGKIEKAHRFSWFLSFGKIPRGKVILHKCDNPSCVNPEHLSCGSVKDNVHDMMIKGRNNGGLINNPPIGEKNVNAKISNKTAENIRQAIKDGYETKTIINHFGVSKYIISRIRTGRSWSKYV